MRRDRQKLRYALLVDWDVKHRDITVSPQVPSASSHHLRFDSGDEVAESFSDFTTNPPAPLEFSLATIPWKTSKRLRPPKHKSSTSASPIACLPVEILQLIFDHYIHSSDFPCGKKKTYKQMGLITGSYRRVRVDSEKSGLPFQTTPMHLAHVCSHWREVALTTSSLWNRLVVERPLLRDVSLFEFWMARTESDSSRSGLDSLETGGPLLDLRIIDDRAWRKFNPWEPASASERPLTYHSASISQAIYPIMKSVFNASKRLRSISLTLGPCAAPHFSRAMAGRQAAFSDYRHEMNSSTSTQASIAVLRSTSIPTPSLKDLTINLSHLTESNDPDVRQIRKLFLSLTDCTDLRAISLNMHHNLSGRRVRWDRTFADGAHWAKSLLELRVDGNSTMCQCELINALKNLPKLEVVWVMQLRVCGASHHSAIHSRGTGAEILLPRLTEMHLNEVKDVAFLLDSFTTPSLHTLTAGLGSGTFSSRHRRNFGALQTQIANSNWKSLENLVKRSKCRITTLAWGATCGVPYPLDARASLQVRLVELSLTLSGGLNHLRQNDEVLEHFRRASDRTYGALRYLRKLELRAPVSWKVLNEIVMGSLDGGAGETGSCESESERMFGELEVISGFVCGDVGEGGQRDHDGVDLGHGVCGMKRVACRAWSCENVRAYRRRNRRTLCESMGE